MKANNYPYYAIQISGARNNVFTLRKVVAQGATNPVNGIRYKTEQKARIAANELRIEIEKIGDSYQIA